MKVSIHRQKWIKPATPTPPHLQKHQLSAIDELQPSTFVQLILHFDIDNETQLKPATSERLARLQESLSKILTLYYPFAGRYNNEDEDSISCKDQGLIFVVATVDCKLAEVDEGGEGKEGLVRGLEKVGRATNGAGTPVVSIQVNVFTCGGIAMGLSFLHRVSDMFTFSTFMNAWATSCHTGTLHQILRPIFNLSSFLPQKHHFPKPSKPANPPPPPPNFVSKRFIFTKQTILKLKAIIAKTESNTNNYTRVQLITALITRNLVKMECSKGAKPRPFAMVHAMNLRSRATFSIGKDSYFCGNFYTVANVRGVENESWELGQLAELTRSSIKHVASAIDEARDSGELSSKVEKNYTESYEELSKGKEEVNFMGFSSWCRFPLVEIDFGWGKPSLVRVLPSPFAITYLMDYENGGMEAWVCLKEDEMACFQRKTDILEYAVS